MISRISKYLISSLLVLLLIITLPLAAYAAQPNFDIAKTGSIRVSLREAASPAVLVGGKLELYKVGDAVEADSNLTFVPTAAFASSGISLSDVQASGLALALADYAKAQNLSGTSVSTTT